MEREARKSVLMKVGIVVVLIVAIGFVIYQKGNRTPAASGNAGLEHDEEVYLPRFVDVGSDKCVPCKLMAPIIEELEKEYEGIFDVEFINTRDDESATRYYEIRMIPTQIFYDAEGNELFRHEGFFSKEDILGKWTELGIDIEKQ